MTDDEFDERYGALKAALLSAWREHAGDVPADARGLRGQLIGALTSTSMLIAASEVGLEQCHALFVAIGQFHQQQLDALHTQKGRMH